MSGVNGSGPGTAPSPEPPAAPTAGRGMEVDDDDLKSSYCNVCNVNSTREEVVLNFGVNHGWDRTQGGKVALQHRVILSPQAAKRVAAMLNKVVQDYESRHGTLT